MMPDGGGCLRERKRGREKYARSLRTHAKVFNGMRENLDAPVQFSDGDELARAMCDAYVAGA
jgi:hypothetical protein